MDFLLTRGIYRSTDYTQRRASACNLTRNRGIVQFNLFIIIAKCSASKAAAFLWPKKKKKEGKNRSISKYLKLFYLFVMIFHEFRWVQRAHLRSSRIVTIKAAKSFGRKFIDSRAKKKLGKRTSRCTCFSGFPLSKLVVVDYLLRGRRLMIAIGDQSLQSSQALHRRAESRVAVALLPHLSLSLSLAPWNALLQLKTDRLRCDHCKTEAESRFPPSISFYLIQLNFSGTSS